MRDLACRFSVKRLKSCCKASECWSGWGSNHDQLDKVFGECGMNSNLLELHLHEQTAFVTVISKTLRLIGLSRILSYTNYESGKFHSLGRGSTLGEKHWSEASREVVYLTPFSAFFPHCGAWSLGTNSKAFTCKLRDNTTHHSKGLIT